VPNLAALFLAGVFLFVFVEQNQQVNVLPLLQVQVQVAIAAAFSFVTAGIGDASFANTAETRDHRATLRIAVQVVLDGSQDLVGVVAGELMELPRERARTRGIPQ
jgi:membrane protein implicated in regulation of membrane protease activity